MLNIYAFLINYQSIFYIPNKCLRFKDLHIFRDIIRAHTCNFLFNFFTFSHTLLSSTCTLQKLLLYSNITRLMTLSIIICKRCRLTFTFNFVIIINFNKLFHLSHKYFVFFKFIFTFFFWMFSRSRLFF